MNKLLLAGCLLLSISEAGFAAIEDEKVSTSAEFDGMKDALSAGAPVVSGVRAGLKAGPAIAARAGKPKGVVPQVKQCANGDDTKRIVIVGLLHGVLGAVSGPYFASGAAAGGAAGRYLRDKSLTVKTVAIATVLGIATGVAVGSGVYVGAAIGATLAGPVGAFAGALIGGAVTSMFSSMLSAKRLR